MNEDITQVKLSMPLIDEIELNRIDSFYNDIVDEYTKAFVKEKEQVIIQRVMKNLRQENEELQQENQQLKERIDKAIEKLEEAKEFWKTFTPDNSRIAIKHFDKFLEILKD